VTNLSNRKAAERFQRSGDTISRYFHAVHQALTSKTFYQTYVRLPDVNTHTPMEIALSPKLSPFFDECLGAFDGCHIDCSPPAEARARYRNRK
ncbi:hypothetical protein M422DRAFT_140800, partial [Sphaerobolus stellatus SS14]